MSEIRLFCLRCRGSGEVPGSQPDPLDPGSYDPVMVTCGLCEGTGGRIAGEIIGDILDKLSDMDDKLNDIFEKVNE